MAIMGLLRRCLTAIRRPQLERDLRDEIDRHIEQRRQRLVADGMDPREAVYEARRMFGNVTAIREESRDMWGFRTLDTIGQDLRYGMRMLKRSPAFTAVAVLSLAIGIGATAAVFSLADALLFRKLPVRAPDELVVFRWFSGPITTFESLNGYGAADDNGFSSTSFSRVAYETLRTELVAKADVFGFADLYQVNLSIDGRPETAFGHAVSGNYYSTLGLVPAAGRFISDADDRIGASPVAMISHDFWQRRFGGGDALGRAVVVNGVTLTIVGVAPQGFRGTLQVAQPHDISIPLSAYPLVTRGDDPASPNHWWVLMMARLKPGVRPEHLQPDADVILKRTVAAAKPELGAAALPRLTLDAGSRGQLEDRNGMRDPLKAMALVVGIVLLVACVNVASLLLARGRARTRELSVRVAIGAPRTRVVRQLLTEGLLLASLGSTLGLLFARSIADSLAPALSLPEGSPVVGAHLDWRVFVFTAGLAAGCSLLFGLVPALRATDVKVASGLQEAARSAVGARHRNRLSAALVAVQVALSMLLVTCAALLVYSVRNLGRIDPGFDPRGVLTFRIDPGQNGYDEARARNLYASAVERLSALPGVRSAAFARYTLISNSSAIGTARPAGVAAPAPDSPDARQFMRQHRAWRLAIGEAFLKTMGIPLMAGRMFGPADTETSPRVAIVNVRLARQLFGTSDAIGRRFVLGLEPGNPEIEIVGIAADAKYTSMRSDPPPTAYLPYRQDPMSFATFVVRTHGDPAAAAPLVRETMREIDPTLPLASVRTQEEQILASLGRERLFARLSTLLGVVTLLLAAIGLYGLMAYVVTSRTPEIGVRMALGAERGSVRWMILRQSLVLVVVGLALGVPAAIAGTKYLESMLFGLTPTDPLAMAVAAAALLAISLGAAFVPAQRASCVDPIVALRTE